jgi:hypothetical protein
VWPARGFRKVSLLTSQIRRRPAAIATRQGRVGAAALKRFRSFYDPEAYQRCVDEVRQASKWRPSGDVDLLLLNFEYETATGSGDFNFTEAIPLPVGQMIIQGKVPNIQVFVQELINHARDTHAQDRANPVSEIHQRLALNRGRRSLWQWVSRTFLKDAGRIYDDMRPCAVCNLAKAMNPG